MISHLLYVFVNMISLCRLTILLSTFCHLPFLLQFTLFFTIVLFNFFCFNNFFICKTYYNRITESISCYL